MYLSSEYQELDGSWWCIYCSELEDQKKKCIKLSGENSAARQSFAESMLNKPPLKTSVEKEKPLIRVEDKHGKKWAFHYDQIGVIAESHFEDGVTWVHLKSREKVFTYENFDDLISRIQNENANHVSESKLPIKSD